MVVKKRLCPAITYWIALTTPNGAPANPLVVLRALLECGVEAVANQVYQYLYSWFARDVIAAVLVYR
jgi:hypothetical protein